MKKLIIVLSIAVLFVTFESCDVLQQATELHTFSKCEFRLNTIDNIKLAGVDVQNIKDFSDINFIDAAKISQALLTGNLPLSFRLNVEAKNPNQKTAALNKLEWILFIDDIEMTSGTTNERIEIPANNGQSILPLYMSFDLFDILKGETADAIMNFGLNLSGNGNRPTRIMVKARPTIIVGGTVLNYPGYITVTNEYKSAGSTGSGNEGAKKAKF